MRLKSQLNQKENKMTINFLIKIYKKWTEINNLPYVDADDLHYDLCDDYQKNKRQIQWLKRFIFIHEKLEAKN